MSTSYPLGKAAEIIANPVRKLQMPFETNPWGICNDCKIPLGNCQGFVSKDICANFLQKKPLKFRILEKYD